MVVLLLSVEVNGARGSSADRKIEGVWLRSSVKGSLKPLGLNEGAESSSGSSGFSQSKSPHIASGRVARKL